MEVLTRKRKFVWQATSRVGNWQPAVVTGFANGDGDGDDAAEDENEDEAEAG